MMIAPAALSCWTMNASDGRAAGERPRAGGRRHAGRVDVVLDDDRDAEERPMVAAAAGLVGGAGVGEGRRADRDDGVELRVQLLDPVQVELDELDRRQPVPVHQRLELRDRRRVDVDAGDPWCLVRAAPRGPPAPRRRRPRAGGPAGSRGRGNGEQDCASRGPPRDRVDGARLGVWGNAWLAGGLCPWNPTCQAGGPVSGHLPRTERPDDGGGRAAGRRCCSPTPITASQPRSTE